MAGSAAAEALCCSDGRAVRFDVAATATAEAGGVVDARTVALDVAAAAAVVALLGIGGARLRTCRRLMAWLQTVKAPTAFEGAVVGEMAHCNRQGIGQSTNKARKEEV